MNGFRIAAQTRCLAQSIKKALHTAASLECDGVQIDARSELRPSDLSDTGLRQLLKMLDDLNLRVGSVVFPTRRGLSNPIDLQPRLEATQTAMQLASRLKSRILITQLGPLAEDDDTKASATLVDAVQSLATLGDRIGIRLVVQTSTSPERLSDFVSRIPEGSLSLDLHPARLIAQGESPATFVELAGQHIAHVHASDGVHDLASGQGVEVELGRGTADFPELIGKLEEYGYRDWLTIERNHSGNRLEEIGNAVKYLRSL